jgi:outer membrane protein OmpA-like peptidoglycan-associated protein
MIDSLYPIMGGMISKYVTSAIKELMETINRKIDEGLSLERIKRKIKSKVTGVSETELLLEESSEARISSLFVIHKKSSLLISEARLKENEINDPHMIASMASAIKDFINDWIQSGKDHDEIQLLSYGNATLYIESAGSVYLIAFMDAEPDQEQRMEINQFFASLVKKYMDFFHNFDGDDNSDEVKSLSRELQNYLDNQKALSRQSGIQAKSKYTQYLVLAVLIGLSIPLAYWIKDRYLEHRIESKIAQKTGCTIEISIEDQAILAKGSVNTFSTLDSIEEIMEKSASLKIINHITIPMTEVKRLYFKQKESIDHNISKLSTSIETLETKLKETEKSIDTLSQELAKQALLNQKSESELAQKEKEIDKITKRENEINRLINLKKDIDKRLKSVFLHSPYFNPKNNTLVFSSNQFFPKGKISMSKESRGVIARVTEKYLSVFLDIPETKKYLKQISVSGHTDSDGTLQYNTQLSKKRARRVANLLSGLEIVRRNGLLPLLKSTGYADQYRIVVDGIEDKNASRRTEIQAKLDEKRISRDIEKLMEEN